MNAIQIRENCAAAGVHLAAGQVYAVPDQVSTKDADLLVRMGRAVGVTAPAAQVEALTDKPARRRRAEAE